MPIIVPGLPLFARPRASYQELLPHGHGESRSRKGTESRELLEPTHVDRGGTSATRSAESGNAKDLAPSTRL